MPPFARRHGGLLAIACLFLVYVLNAWTPSHYGAATRILGIARSGPVMGEARTIRSDEWAVATPYFQIAVASDFGTHDVISPYREPLKGFFALPSRDWSMAFKPDLWGFLVLDPAHAFSLHYALLAAATVFGFALLLRQIGCSPGFALAIGVLVFLSQFVQGWWTSNAPTLAWAPWVVVAFLWRAPWWARAPAVGYAVTVWLIGHLYPPFIVAAGAGLGLLVAAFRPDALRPAHLAPGVIGAAAGLGVAWLHYADLIPVMAATVYPGQRLVEGAGVQPLQVLAHLLPYLVTRADHEPLGLWVSNACEIGVVGSLLPLAVLAFCDHRALGRWVAENKVATGVWLGGLVLLAAWVMTPLSGRAFPLLNVATPPRMLWGLGLLLILGLARIAGAVPRRVTWRRAAVFAGVSAGAWAVSKLLLSTTPIEAGWFDLVAVPILIALMLARRAAPAALPARRLVLIALTATAFLTFGQFNPVQPARPIFESHRNLVLDAMRAYSAANPHGMVVVPTAYGAIINGAGIPALNHTLLRPQLAFFRRAYPDMPAEAFEGVFNRYANLRPTVQAGPTAPQLDVIALPPDPFAIPLAVAIGGTAASGPTLQGAVDEIETERLGPRRWAVNLTGWAAWKGVAEGQRLRIDMTPEVGRIVAARGSRLARPEVVFSLNDPAAFAAGFGVRLEIETVEELGKAPVKALGLSYY